MFARFKDSPSFDLSEYLIFVEAYARLERWEDVHRLLQRVSDPAPFLNPALCAIFDRVEQSSSISPAGQAVLEQWGLAGKCQGLP